VREARPADAPALGALLGASDAKALSRRLSALRKAGEPPLVAEQGGEILGVAAFHAVPLLQEAAPLGRLTVLLVAPARRRGGIGRALVTEAEARLAALGCARIEAMAEIELAAAPDFFRRLGWERDSYRYVRTLDDTG
jgi:N-acetylglutamate synthase-like GNAT family acetyltransferase